MKQTSSVRLAALRHPFVVGSGKVCFYDKQIYFILLQWVLDIYPQRQGSHPCCHNNSESVSQSVSKFASSRLALWFTCQISRASIFTHTHVDMYKFYSSNRNSVQAEVQIEVYYISN